MLVNLNISTNINLIIKLYLIQINNLSQIKVEYFS